MTTLQIGQDDFCCVAQKKLDSGLEDRKIRIVAAHKVTAPTKIHPDNKEKHHVFYR
jgi:hypothetical protein